MQWKYQDTLSELNAIANHLYHKEWDELSYDQRIQCHPMKGLLKKIERDFHAEFSQKLQAFATSHRKFAESSIAFDQLERLADS